MDTPLITRTLQPHLLTLASRHPIVTLTGPRQSGKTTLCRMAFPERPYVSLELPEERDYAIHDPRGFLDEFGQGAIIDEVQYAPQLLSYLQVSVDQDPTPGRFILTGSQNFSLVQGLTQSLAGRTALVHLLPFEWNELQAFRTAATDLFPTLWTGGYPAIQARAIPPREWLASYMATYVERDVRQLINIGDLHTFQTFIRLVAGRAGQLLNYSALATACGIAQGTVKAWLSVLGAGFVTYVLTPYHANLNKRLIKTPKLYFYDTGLLCYLLDIRTPAELRHHSARGAIFENWVLSEILKRGHHQGEPTRLHFYRDRKGLEVDCILPQGDRLLALELKSSQTLHPGFFAALHRFDRLMAPVTTIKEIRKVLMYGGERAQHRTDITVLPWSEVGQFDWFGRG